MIERFKPAGHKAQELSEIVLPDETFKPIQRVIDTTIEDEDKTVGYLYHDVEYKKDCVGNIVLSKGLLRGNEGNAIRKSTSGWHEYEGNKKENPQEWLIPSGPLTLELCYRSQSGTTPLSQELQLSWHKTFNHKEWWLRTSTILRYEEGIAHTYHDWTMDAGIAPVPDETDLDLSNDKTPPVNQFLRAILGKRHSSAQQIFGKYGQQVQLWTPNYTGIGECALVLRVLSNDGFDVYAYDDVNYCRPARGISLLKNFPRPQYEVRND